MMKRNIITMTKLRNFLQTMMAYNYVSLPFFLHSYNYGNIFRCIFINTYKQRLKRCANKMSRGIMVTRLAWMAHKFTSSNN